MPSQPSPQGLIGSLLAQAADALRPEAQASRRVLLTDLFIQTKGTALEPPRLVQFTPNAVQEAILDDLCPLWRTDPEALCRLRGIREIDLKARQFGVSTLILALYFLITVNNPDTYTVVIADDMDNSEALFQKVHIFWEHLPAEKQPHLKHATKRELHFDRIRSRFSVITAGKTTGGRSRTIQNLHCSEVAFWPDPDILTGLLQAVPLGGNVFQESTANGETEDGFCSEYRKSAKGMNAYRARFIPWWQHPEYETPPPTTVTADGDTVSDFDRTDEDNDVATRYDLDSLFGAGRTDAKLFWRRNKRAEPGMGNLFAQEYPGDDKEAFRVSGLAFFTEWDEDRHIVEPFDIPKWWKRLGGDDWGYGKPFCYLHGAIDGNGGIVLFGEAYGPKMLNHEQTALIRQIQEEDGQQPDQVEIYCDPSMWNEKHDKQGVGYRDIDDYFGADLWCIKANNTRTGGGGHGWSNVRRYLHDTITDSETGETYPALRIVRGTCPNLCRTMPQMKHDDHKPEDMDSELEDHPADTLRYLLNSHPRAPLDPHAAKPKAPDRWTKLDEAYRKTKAKPFL